jgi:UDP-N-acetylmuramate dehydrogenase
MYNLLKGNRGIISGALDQNSIAWKVAERAHAEGAVFVVTRVTFRLKTHATPKLEYKDLKEYFSHSETMVQVGDVRRALHEIRGRKFPDLTTTGTAGSFFKNALIEDWQLTELTQKFPDIKTYDMGNGTVKVPTGWLIEKVGLKGKTLHGMKVHDKNALVLINESAKSYADIAAARDEIIGAVRDTFRIQIEQILF